MGFDGCTCSGGIKCAACLHRFLDEEAAYSVSALAAAKSKRGRPRLSAAPAESLTIRIPAELRKAMERDAVARRESIGEYVRAAIEDRVGPVPHTSATRRALEKLASMTPAELRQTFVDAGIYTSDGRLTPEYGGSTSGSTEASRPKTKKPRT